MADILQTIERYRALGIDQQIDYKKFYLYSIITHSTALSIESENENCLVGPYDEVPNQRLTRLWQVKRQIQTLQAYKQTLQAQTITLQV